MKKQPKNPREKLFTVYRDKVTGNVYPDDYGNDRHKKLAGMRQVIASLGANADGELMLQVIAREVQIQVARVIEGSQQKVVGATSADLEMIKKRS